MRWLRSRWPQMAGHRVKYLLAAEIVNELASPLTSRSCPRPSPATACFTNPRLCAAIVDRLTFGGNITRPAPPPTAWPTLRAARWLSDRDPAALPHGCRLRPARPGRLFGVRPLSVLLFVEALSRAARPVRASPTRRQ